MNFNKIFILAILSLTLSACGSSSTSSTSSGGTTSGGSDDSSSFQVTGELASTTLSVASKADGDTETVTDVLAVNPETGNVSCQVVDIEDDGSFSVPITNGHFWGFYFINRLRQGQNMFLGWLRSGRTDALITNSTSGTLNLGTVTVDNAAGTASSDQNTSDITSGLGLDSETADNLDDMDDVAGRYSNPDADNDGEIDCSQSSGLMLDFHIRFDMQINGTNATVNDIIDAFYDTATPRYNSTGVYVNYLNTYSSATTGTVTFVDSDVIIEGGTTIEANTEIDEDAAENSFGEYNSYGVNLSGSGELPSGAIVFKFGTKEVTFTNIETPSLTTLNAPTGRIFPFVRFDLATTGCTENCALSGISYKWMKKTASGWTAATTTELGLIVKDNSANIGIRIGGDANKYIGVLIPEDSISGTITWEADNFTLTGATEAEFNAFVTTQICHVGLSHEDKLGMKYFQNITNSNDDCSS